MHVSYSSAGMISVFLCWDFLCNFFTLLQCTTVKTFISILEIWVPVSNAISRFACGIWLAFIWQFCVMRIVWSKKMCVIDNFCSESAFYAELMKNEQFSFFCGRNCFLIVFALHVEFGMLYLKFIEMMLLMVRLRFDIILTLFISLVL